MRRWMVALVAVLVLSVVVSGWVTVWLMVEDQRSAERRLDRQIEAIHDSQECVLRLMLVEPVAREGFTVERILASCPDALPERNA